MNLFSLSLLNLKCWWKCIWQIVGTMGMDSETAVRTRESNQTVLHMEMINQSYNSGGSCGGRERRQRREEGFG